MPDPPAPPPQPLDAFERAYTAALTVAPAIDAREHEREAREGEARAEPGEPFALHGCVLTPEEALEAAFVVVAGSTITELRDTQPRSTRTIATDGVILPGLIDLHGHPEYNVFAPWEPPHLFLNRYEWRRSDEYAALIKAPWARLTSGDEGMPSLLPILTRYAEARALVGGTTAIQGASGQYPDPHESLVRNVDRLIFGERPGRSLVDPARARPAEIGRLRDGIAAGDIRALYLHLAEGVDDQSRNEFADLVDAGLLTPATVIIHGTALDPAQFRQVADAGAKLVWSPQSNLRLYGATTNAAQAFALDIPVGVGADWLPSGSPALLDELQVARRVLGRQGSHVEPRRLVRAVTSDAATIAGLGDRLGRVRVGAAADLVVLERHHADPWESVLRSDRRSIELVTIGGDVAYGRRAWVETLAGPTEREPVDAWGRDMALDLTYSVITSSDPPPRMADLRAQLLDRHPQIGPIFA